MHFCRSMCFHSSKLNYFGFVTWVCVFIEAYTGISKQLSKKCFHSARLKICGFFFSKRGVYLTSHIGVWKRHSYENWSPKSLVTFIFPCFWPKKCCALFYTKITVFRKYSYEIPRYLFIN